MREKAEMREGGGRKWGEKVGDRERESGRWRETLQRKFELLQTDGGNPSLCPASHRH